ncbi:MAG: 30S ribosomal protein S3 [Chloroflexi bacterium]|nr:30S ribosomal protein S3 [Chloroflexota bacterium]
MGRKVHPIGFRLGITKPWQTRWFARDKQTYVEQLHQDREVRALIRKLAPRAGISRIEIERFPTRLKVYIQTAKPGILIGRKGENIKRIRRALENLVKGKGGVEKVEVDIKEIKEPELDAVLVARNIAEQLERRVAYRRAMKRAIEQAMRRGAQGIKIQVAGRLAGAEMARTVWLRDGRVPLQTIRADIDFAKDIARTTYGVIGVKVWIYKGEILPEKEKGEAEEAPSQEKGVYVSR